MPKHTIVIRDAVAEDTMALAELAMQAGHGLLEIFYGGLIPGKTTVEIVADRRMRRAGSFSETSRWRIAEDARGIMLGAVNCFPHAVFETAAPDPLLGADRMAATASLSDLEAEARGTYYLNMIAVFPARRGGGIGAALVAEAERLARRHGFHRLTLSTFEADAALVGFYRRNGFRILGTRPIAPHAALEHGGNWALMAKDLAA